MNGNGWKQGSGPAGPLLLRRRRSEGQGGEGVAISQVTWNDFTQGLTLAALSSPATPAVTSGPGDCRAARYSGTLTC
eukprot:383836-Hanusia_phi.AAC.2